MAFYRPAPYQKPLAIALLLAMLVLPNVLTAFGQEFYIGFATRILIFALLGNYFVLSSKKNKKIKNGY